MVLIQSSTNFVRMFIFIKSVPVLKTGHVRSKTRSLCQLLEKQCVLSRWQSFYPVFKKLCQNVHGGGRVVRRCRLNFQCFGVLLVWIAVGQGPTALAVGAGGGCLDIFSLVYHFPSFSLSLGDGPIWTEILSQGAVKPKTTNQPECSSL